MLWVVSYDIADDKRRKKLSKVLEGYGRRVQYSVFECDIDEKRCQRLEKSLQKLINQEEDDVRFYPLNEGDLKRVRMLGKARLQRARSYYVV